MKKQLFVITLLLVTSLVFSQKDAMKSAKKAIAKNDFTTALDALSKVESLKANLDEKTMAKYLYYKVQALNGNGNLVKAANAVNALTSYEEKAGKQKYSIEAKPILTALIKGLSDRGIKEYQTKNFSSEMILSINKGVLFFPIIQPIVTKQASKLLINFVTR